MQFQALTTEFDPGKNGEISPNPSPSATNPFARDLSPEPLREE